MFHSSAKHRLIIVQSHRKLAKAMREFVDEYLYEDAQVCSLVSFFKKYEPLFMRRNQLHEDDGKRPSPHIIQKMA